jgi:hypothetical protein
VQESIELVTKMAPHFLSLIDKTLVAVDGDNSLLQKRNELQGQLCAALQARRCSCCSFCPGLTLSGRLLAVLSM